MILKATTQRPHQLPSPAHMSKKLPSVCASAPGKVILFGEHAVVYGEPALAAALSDLRIFVLVQPIPEERTVSICMPDLPNPINFYISTEKIIRLAGKLGVPPTAACAAVIETILLDDSSLGEKKLESVAIAALTPLIYLIHVLLDNVLEHWGLSIQVRSQYLPVGAGLGSSAAFSVASAAAMLQLQRLHSSSDPPAELSNVSRPDSELLREINQYAYSSEILLHGTPSGIDNAVSTYGGAILFTKPPPLQQLANDGDSTSKPSNVQMQFYSTDQLPALASMTLMIVDTHVPRSTKHLVAGVRAFYNLHTAVVSCLLKGMGQIATTAVKWLVSKQDCSHKDALDNSNYLLQLVETNQYLLQAVGVSHASLDRICQVVKQVAPGRAAAKLTGAGGGGCAIVLMDAQADEALQARVKAALLQNAMPWRFSCLSSNVGGDGVLLLPPSDFPTKTCRRRGSGMLDAVARLQTETIAKAAIAVSFVTVLMYAFNSRSGRRS